MKNVTCFFICFAGMFILSCTQKSTIDLSKIDPGTYDDTWWNRTPVRFMQTNLREIDATDMDVDSYVQSVIDASVNVVLFSVGGQVANYPTELPFHFRNPHMEGDLVGEAVTKLKENGIRVMARFDFSRLHESIALENPDWLYVGTHGNHVNYNGMVHTCINGDYQQKYGFDILNEALSAYPFDAIFFNMAGYVTSDYSQVYHGICQCNNCKERFYDMTGNSLPLEVDWSDPVFREYDQFKGITHSEFNDRINKFIQELDPNLVLSVYQAADEGIRRTESGTPYTSGDYWNYDATENVKRTLGSFKKMSPFDTYNHLKGMDYRHVATPPDIGRLFLPQQMFNGGALGIYFIGHLENQYDRVFLPHFKDIYKFHQTNEKLFTNLQPETRVALIQGARQENRGLMNLLIEEHIMFDLINASSVGGEHAPRSLEDYDAVILSNINNMDDEFVSRIDEYVNNGGKLLVTGFPGIDNGTGVSLDRIRLESLGVLPEYEMFTNPRSTYLLVTEDDKAVLGLNEFEDFDVIMMNSRFLKARSNGSAKGFLSLVPNTMHGPPEKCYFTNADVTDVPGIFINTFGSGKSVFIPWQIGAQYQWRGNNAQRALFMAALNNLLEVEQTLITDASPLIEMTHMSNRNGAFEWIGMINHSGQIGNSFRKQVEIRNTTIRFKPLKPVKEIHLMRAGERLKFRQNQGWVEVIVPSIDNFEMLVCLY